MEDNLDRKIKDPNDFSEICILIVDDEDVYRKFIAAIVEKNFMMKPVLCKNPKEAFDYMKNVKVPDLVILDMQMPIMDGLSALKFIRSGAKTKDVNVIINTALGTDSLLIELFKLGISDYILKPAETKIVTSKILNVLKKIKQNKSK